MSILRKLRPEQSWVADATIALWLSAIFTLYLAPSKNVTADFLTVSLLVITLCFLRVRRLGVLEVLEPLLPLFMLLLYVFVFEWLTAAGSWGVSYARELINALQSFLLFYVLFRNRTPHSGRVLICAVFVVPGLVHLVYMYVDIITAVQGGDVLFASSSRQGVLEHIKDVPRVGRRYLSLALLHFLCGILLIGWHLKASSYRYWIWGVSCLVGLSLALIDARAAYASSLIGGGLWILAVGPTRVWAVIKACSRIKPWVRLAGVLVLGMALALGYAAGKSRWQSMSYSLVVAGHDVFYSKDPVSQRPYVRESYWSEPIADARACYLEGHFRCKVDQSAYLRFAWFLTGLNSLVEHPFGIGYSVDYLARLWGVEGEAGYFQHNDSFLIGWIISYGFPGLSLYVWLILGVCLSFRKFLLQGSNRVEVFFLAGLVLITLGRGVIDQLNEGLWPYLMALMGLYYGLLKSKQLNREQVVAKCLS